MRFDKVELQHTILPVAYNEGEGQVRCSELTVIGVKLVRALFFVCSNHFRMFSERNSTLLANQDLK